MAEATGSGDGSALLASICLAFLVGIFGVLAFVASKMSSPGEEQPRGEAREAKGKEARKRGALDRMQRSAGARAAASSASPGAEGDADDAEEDEDDGEDAGGRAGRRGAQKDQRKQEKKAQQQAEKEHRHQKDSVKTERQQKYSDKQKDKESERQRQEEEERQAKEEKEKSEQEEFEKWKQMFAVDEEGEADAAHKDESAVERFIEHVKMRKVVNLEDLAAEFRMRTAAAIDRLEQLEKLGRLSGIFDDRGKYIFITTEEMQDVAEWLQRKGRINRADLVAACNRLVRLNPTEEDKAKLQKEAQDVAETLDEGAEEGEEKAE